MYIEKVFVYLVMGLIVLLILRTMRNDIRISRMETVMRALGQHGKDVDNTVKSLIGIMERFFEGLRENINKNKERADELRRQQEEKDRESKSQ